MLPQHRITRGDQPIGLGIEKDHPTTAPVGVRGASQSID
jgi:hypothetical protein